MNILNYFWSFVKNEGERYLDCEIITSSGNFMTNKCFLRLSDVIWNCLEHQMCNNYTLLMPSYKDTDIINELCGFVVQSDNKKDHCQVSWIPETQTRSSDQQMESPVLELNVQNWKAYPSSNASTVPKPKGQYCKNQKDAFQCEHCGKVFSSSKQCRQHRYQVHKQTVDHCCPICTAKFKTKSILSNHLKTHNSPSFSCDFCSKVCICIAIKYPIFNSKVPLKL